MSRARLSSPCSRAAWTTLGSVLVAISGCSPPPPAAAVPSPDPQVFEPAPAPMAPAPLEKPAGTDDAAVMVAGMLQHMARLRELPPASPVHARVIDRGQMLEQVRATVREQVPADAIRGESDFLQAMGFLPESFDYEAGVYRMLQSELAGYYDPEKQLMFLMDDLKPTDRETTLAHELVHALQDQHYNLGPKLRFVPDGNDRQAAIQCLAEGDATSAMLDFLLGPSQRAVDIPADRLRAQMAATTAASPDLASFPRVLRSSLTAPYVDGVLFVQQLRWRGGWATVDEVWSQLPTTTEQILHLDKLDKREPAEVIPVPSGAALGTGWIASHTDVYGEQGLRICLEDWMDPSRAASAAAGWGGDHAAVFRRRSDDQTESAAAWHVRFDQGPLASPDFEAVEAFVAITAGWGASPQQSSACRTLPTGRTLAVVRVGRDVAIVATPRHGSSDGIGATCRDGVRWAAEVARQR